MKTPGGRSVGRDTDPDIGNRRSVDPRPKLTHEEAFATGTDIEARYRVVRALGEGGMAIVYLVRDMKFEMDVVYLALKVLKYSEETHSRASWKKAVARFSFEARAMSRVSHPHVLPVYDVGEHEAYPYFIAKYIDEGYTLEDAIQKTENTGLPFSRCKALAIQILQALAAAHAAGIIHRDVKPDNILIQRIRVGSKTVEHVYLCDLGIAALNLDAQPTGLTISGPEVKLTVIGEVFGTPAYFSPEQAQGLIAEICPATDLYAMGSVFAAMLTGKLPFYSCKTMTDLMYSHVHTTPPTLEELSPGGTGKLFPEGCEAVYRRCMAKSPKDRFQSASDMIDAIAALPEFKEESMVITMPRKVQREAVPDLPGGEETPSTETPFEHLVVPVARSGQTLTPSVMDSASLGIRSSRPDMDLTLPVKRFPRLVMALMASVTLAILGVLWYQSQRSSQVRVTTQPQALHTPIVIPSAPEPAPHPVPPAPVVPPTVPPVIAPIPEPIATPPVPQVVATPPVEEPRRHGRANSHHGGGRRRAPRGAHTRPSDCESNPFIPGSTQIRTECS